MRSVAGLSNLVRDGRIASMSSPSAEKSDLKIEKSASTTCPNNYLEIRQGGLASVPSNQGVIELREVLRTYF